MAEPLLELARARAAREGLANVEFRRGDATGTGLADGSFDAVVCVFGVFFAPDMTAFAAEMWRLVRPGGALAITTWGPGLFEPATGVFWAVVGEIEPSLVKAYQPWDKLTGPAGLAGLFTRAGASGRPSRTSPGSTVWIARRTSGTSCSAPGTGPPWTPSAPSSAAACMIACRASCDRPR